MGTFPTHGENNDFLNGAIEQMAVIDDSHGIFSTTSEAYARGKSAGRQELFDAAIQRLSEISLEHEKNGRVEEFRVAEMCCGTLRSAKIILDQKVGARDTESTE
jgi:hypothetical protein